MTMASSAKLFTYIESLSFIFLLVLQFQQAAPFSMLTRGQRFVLQTGDSIRLDCEFYTKYFHLFDNPIIWIKTQYHERTRINIMSNINSPFVSTGRFKITFIPATPRYRLLLDIERVSLEDSGNYTCEVRGPETSVLGIVDHQVFVEAPIQDLIMNEDNCTEMCDPATPTTLAFTDNEPSLLQCVSTGGNPPPSIKVYMDDFDITYRFRSETFTRLLGIEGLRIIHYSVHTRTRHLILDTEDEGKDLKCTATVAHLPVNVTTSTIRVNYGPVITCTDKAAYLNENHAHLTCFVRSRPRVHTLYWLTDNNGTMVTEEAKKGAYWTRNFDGSEDVVESGLYLRKIDPSSFRTYTIVAENTVGQSQMDVRLLHKNGNNMGDSFPHYSEIGDDRPLGQVDYTLIRGDAQRHLANTCMTLLAAILVFVQISC